MKFFETQNQKSFKIYIKDNTFKIKDKIGDNTFYTNGAISSEVYEASKVGVNILKKGGNSVDAAIATAICVGIINQFSSGIGGGAFMVIMDESKKESPQYYMIDSREMAPTNINIEKIQKNPKNSIEGGLAVCIPGEIKGYIKAHKKFGKLPWKDLFEENIQIAKKFKVSKILEKRLFENKAHIFKDEGLKETYTRNGELLKHDEYCYRENLSKTLKKISEDPESFYIGSLADDIINFVNKKGGCLTKKDFSDYESVFRDVLTGKYKDYEIITSGLPSAGIFLIEILKTLEKYNLNILEKNQKLSSYHVLVEIFKFVYSQRADYCDPDFLQNYREMIKNKISDKRSQEIFNKINLKKVLDETEYNVKKHTSYDNGTTHINVVDSNNISVLLTSSIDLAFGSKILDPKTGICFNSTINDFYIPGINSAYLLSSSPKNILHPGKRPFSSIAPLILKNNNETILLGGAGGSRIPTNIILVIFYMELGLSMEEAINAPRFHHQFNPNILYIENILPRELREELTKFGHQVKECITNSNFTSVQSLIIRTDENKKKRIFAYSDPRKGGKPDGY
ncbi:gamma glutamyltranspeptidase [Spraguea lophii 42_110]|uniref:Glutathione hydrolase n=1 Tax=Spraguea lophii (strain 42_110) TaxID=1358809 RepID=S7WAN5_SPRLO|nr:gamma glutamyltranspeptidase [Spraguea lophii 42_110]